MSLHGRNDSWTEQDHRYILKKTNNELWRFVQKNASVAPAEDIFVNLTGVSKKNLQLLCEIYFLLSDEVREFVEEIAPSILNRLSKVSLREYKVLRGNIRGKVNWGKTLTERYASGGDQSIFVCSQRSSLFDLPENRLLLFLLKRIVSISKSLSGNDISETNIDLNRFSDKWVDTVTEFGLKANKLLKNPFIREIGEMYDLSFKVIMETEKTRGQMYTRLANIGRMYYLILNKPINYLEEVLNIKTLEPLNKDTLYEIAVLFKFFSATRRNGWIEKNIGLIGGSSSIISHFKLGTKKLKVYYQSIPKEFEKESRYGPLMNKYGLSDRFRRPDIVVEVTNRTKKSYYIIEVKRSNKRGYLVDGAYKLFGYLKDFESVKGNENNLSGVLVGWSNIKDLDSFDDNEIHISSWKNLDNLFDYILNEELKVDI
ncbi:hypothetical protein [Ornithinibacillus sp. JPR2-1]|uniref:hypothetical protein n=1 Tax=Ornithinibacillus sp. JPR2-1 TaxID=2094019 RepID=UPI0031E3CD21